MEQKPAESAETASSTVLSDPPQAGEAEAPPAKAGPETKHSTLSPLAGIIAVLVFLLVISCFAGFLLAGCESVLREAIAPRVIDSANMLSQSTVRRIEELHFPKDIPVLVR